VFSKNGILFSLIFVANLKEILKAGFFIRIFVGIWNDDSQNGKNLLKLYSVVSVYLNQQTVN